MFVDGGTFRVQIPPAQAPRRLPCLEQPRSRLRHPARGLPRRPVRAARHARSSRARQGGCHRADGQRNLPVPADRQEEFIARVDPRTRASPANRSTWWSTWTTCTSSIRRPRWRSARGRTVAPCTFSGTGPQGPIPFFHGGATPLRGTFGHLRRPAVVRCARKWLYYLSARQAAGGSAPAAVATHHQPEVHSRWTTSTSCGRST